MNTLKDWGPSHQRSRLSLSSRAWRLIAVVVFLCTPVGEHTPLGVLLIAVLVWVLRHRILAVLAVSQNRDLSPRQAWAAIWEQALGHPGVYLGVRDQGPFRVRSWVFSRPERAVLLLGPPRSGKTSTVIIPSILSHHGPVVSTSTKADVLKATHAMRAEVGTVWQFDPTASTKPAAAVAQVRWSPLSASERWDGALLMAHAMVSGARVGAGTQDSTHWARRAQALLAALLHAAAKNGQSMEIVLDWVARHESDQPGVLLENAGPESHLAMLSLLGVASTEQRERASIFSAAADALEAYTSTGALDSCQAPNFDADRFVLSTDTLYLHAPADRQSLVSPLICGLLSEIRQATYRAHSTGDLKHRVFFALDEVANIAPIEELPQIASEGGGQGLMLLAGLQDLSQARARWGTAADGFLTLFGTKLILPGVADQRTLETVSTLLGEYDRPVITHTKPARGHASATHPATPTTSRSTQRTRVLSAGEVANIPAGHGLHLDGVGWELLSLTPAHTTQPWATAIHGEQS